MVIQHCPFSPHRFRDQKSASRFQGIERCRMNLNIIQILQTYPMRLRYSDRIAGQMREIRRMLIITADSAAGKNRMICINLKCLPLLLIRPIRLPGQNSRTGAIFFYNICHLRILINRHVRKLLHPLKQSQLFGRRLIISCNLGGLGYPSLKDFQI